MANQKPENEPGNPSKPANRRDGHVSPSTKGKVYIQKEKNSGVSSICPSIKRNEKISFDSADKLAEEIAALRDKKS